MRKQKSNWRISSLEEKAAEQCWTTIQTDRVRIPKYNGKHMHHFTMWVMKFRAYLASQKLTPILKPEFNDSLPDAEDTVLVETDDDDKLKQKALDVNVKGTNVLIMALGTPEIMNKVMLEQQYDVKWPSGIFMNMWESVLADELPDDAVAEMEVEDDLRKLKLPNNKDPKELLVSS